MASEPLLLGGILAIALCGIGYIVYTERRLKVLLQGSGTKNLEGTLAHLLKTIAELETKEREIRAHLANIESRLIKSIQKVETVRFNAFRDSGGGQSFATAFLDEQGNGAILSTLYTRDRVSMFSKPIEHYQSSFALTPEEQAAITKAQE